MRIVGENVACDDVGPCARKLTARFLPKRLEDTISELVMTECGPVHRIDFAACRKSTAESNATVVIVRNDGDASLVSTARATGGPELVDDVEIFQCRFQRHPHA